MYNPYDFYFQKAKKQWFKARSIFKLDEIDQKFHIFGKDTATVVDIGCAPGSWLQYASAQLQSGKVKKWMVIWFDIKPVELNLPGVSTYQQDITDHEAVKAILAKHAVEKIDLIQSDMAPNTIWFRDIDAIRSVSLLEQTYWMYDQLLKPDGKFVIKVFMGPGFEEYLAKLKKRFGPKTIKVFKPKSCRTESKETFIVRF